MGSRAHMGGEDEEVGGQRKGRPDTFFFNEKKKTVFPLRRQKTLKTSTNSLQRKR